MSPATTLASHPPLRQRCSVEILQAATDRRARQPRDLMDGLQAAPSRRPYLSGCEHPLTALIELRAESIPVFANRLRVDHAKLRTAGSPHQESHHPSHITAWRPGTKRFTCCGGCPKSRPARSKIESAIAVDKCRLCSVRTAVDAAGG